MTKRWVALLLLLALAGCSPGGSEEQRDRDDDDGHVGKEGESGVCAVMRERCEMESEGK